MGPIYSLEDVIDVARRRAMLIFAVTVLGAVFAVFIALSRPHGYQSIEVIQIERPLITEELAPTTVEGTSGRRLQLVQQQITTRGVMLEVIDKYDLFEEMPGSTPLEKAQSLREAVVINGIAAAQEGELDDGEISVLTISVSLGSPEIAQRVAQEFSARTIELYAARRIEEARSTLEFFEEQEARGVADLQALEAEITAFRTAQNLNQAGSLEFRRSQMVTLSEAILTLDREKIAVQREIDGIDRQGQRASTVEREINALTTQLQSLEGQRAVLQQRMAALAASIDVSPEIERQLGEFDRRAEQLRLQIASLSERRSAAAVALRLEEDRKSERLIVLEPAALPDFPYTSSRTRMVILLTGVSMVFGVLVALILEVRTPVIRTAAQMEREVGITPVISVPDVALRRTRPGRWSRLFAWFRGQVIVTPPADKPRKLRRP